MSCSVYLPRIYFSNGTCPTGWNDWVSPTATRYYYAQVVTYRKDPVVPKWWRWFDVFRAKADQDWFGIFRHKIADDFGSPCGPVRQSFRRVQERYATQQRRMNKRRAYVQKLRTTSW